MGAVDFENQPDISELITEQISILKPDTWNNIPVCLVKSVTIILESLTLLSSTMQQDRFNI
jgi:hypothetical protein